MLFGKISADSRLIGASDILGGDEVIHDNAKSIRISELCCAALLKSANREGRGDVVSYDHINRRFDDFARAHLLIGVRRKNFLGESLSHETPIS